MTGVGDVFNRIATKMDGQRDSECGGDPLERIEVQCSDASLRSTDDGSTYASTDR